MDRINAARGAAWKYYYHNLMNLQDAGKIRLPIIPDDCTVNYHMFYILLENEVVRAALIDYLRQRGIQAVFHYIPLHSSPMGKRLGNKNVHLPVTENLSRRLLRLPLYYDIEKHELEEVVTRITDFFQS
jgi:dTDP-4-amino-4,6-dideoxygalactose transaminase